MTISEQQRLVELGLIKNGGVDMQEDSYKEYAPKDCVLSQILKKEAENFTVSEEQKRRVLEPIQEMILAGEFSRPRRRPIWRIRQFIPIGVLAAVFLVTVVAVYGLLPGKLTEISNAPVPLAGSVPGDNAVTEYVLLDGGEVVIGDVKMKLPNGTYELKIIPPQNKELEQRDGEWIITEGMEIRLCQYEQ
jgi:hypothetical protein